MRWWWRMRRVGVAGLGLFALLLQLFLSFDHVHVDGLIAPRAAADASVVATSKSTAPAQEETPSRLPDDDCPICATMHLAASALLPAPPCIAVSLNFSYVSHQTLIDAFDFRVSRHVLFQTRAPPIA